MRSSHIRDPELLLTIFFVISICSCLSEGGGDLYTSIRFLYEDCLNTPIEHNSYIPTDITKIKVTLIKDNSKIIEHNCPNDGTNTSITINDIPPAGGYKLYIKAYKKDGTNWSGSAENIVIKERSKTFVQINLTRESSLTCTGSMNKTRFLHSSEILNDGRVLIFGGASASSRDFATYYLYTTDVAEIYHPYKIEYSNDISPGIIAGTFSTLKSGMSSGRIGHIYEKLPDGKILIAGGINSAHLVKNPDDFFICIDDNSSFVYDIELFDPSDDSFKVIGRLDSPRAFANSAYINNKVYIIGGFNANFNCNSVSPNGLNSKVAIIDLSNLSSIKVEEKDNPDTIILAGNKIKIAKDKFLFYGGNLDYGIILNSDGSFKKISFEVSPAFESLLPQRQYFPQPFTIKEGSLYLNTGGYYKTISQRYFLRFVSDSTIKIEKDEDQRDLLFGSGYFQHNHYFFQVGGISNIPFTISDSFIVRSSSQSSYTTLNNQTTGVQNLRRERAFPSVTYIGGNNILITGGIYFDQSNNPVILDLSEIYNLNGLLE